MSSDKGYIKVYRNIRDCWVWKDKPFDKGRAWIDLIMMVNHKETTIMFDGRPLKIKRGQCITSLSILADKWGWSRSKVKRFLDDLKAEQMIDEKRHARGTLLTIEKYSNYQGERNSKRNTDETLTSTHTKRSRTQTIMIEECKKNEEEKTPRPELTKEDIAEGWGFE